MIRTVLARIAGLLPLLVGVALVTFFAVRLVPGDAVDAYLGDSYDPVVAAELRTQLGLDQPAYTQFFIWIGGVLTGDLGESLRSDLPVTEVIADRFPATALLAIAALVISLAIAIPAGVLAAQRRGKAFDQISRLLSIGSLSIPSFALAILLILLFAVWLRVLPSGGIARDGSDILTQLRYLVLPAVCLAIEISAVTFRMTRSSFLEVAALDYVRTARAKGLSQARITTVHVLRNSLMPVVTSVGIQVGGLLGGAIVIEQVFSWPGIGCMLLIAIQQRDYPLIQGVVLFHAVLFVLASLVNDLIYTVLDPRLRRG